VSDNDGNLLVDPQIGLLAGILDDLEDTRIANENRLRSLTQEKVDEDGKVRGLSTNWFQSDIEPINRLVASLQQVEHEATLELARRLRAHPLGPWIKAQKGIGDKMAARLLAVIGDPYWHVNENRPRTVSELWSYCGLRVDNETGVAIRRQKGVKSNWSPEAKMRAYLIAEKTMLQLKAPCKTQVKETGTHLDGVACVCSYYRIVYDERKLLTRDRTHRQPCVRCGPKGNPAPTGSAWSDAHKHADALRVTSKEILKDLWEEARLVHERA
jgi:hypothetical protein